VWEVRRHGDLNLCDAWWVVGPEAEGQTIDSVGMLVLQVGIITLQRISAFMINVFLDLWKMFWHEIWYNTKLLLKFCGTYRSIRRNPGLLPCQAGFPSPNNPAYCTNKNFAWK